MDNSLSPTVQVLVAIPAALLGLFFVMRIVIRYERMSILDLRNDRTADRELVTSLRVDLGVLHSDVAQARERAELAYMEVLKAHEQVGACEKRSEAQATEIVTLRQEIGLLRLTLDKNGMTP